MERTMQRWTCGAVLATGLGLGILAPRAQAEPQGRQADFEEQFALSTDRKALLAQLIPGSETFYYWSCLERQHAGDFAAVESLLRTWRERFGDSNARYAEIAVRQHLLTFDQNPKRGWEWLRNQLGPDLSHSADVPGARPEVPTELDPASVSDAAWKERALAIHPRTVTGLRGAALERMAAEELDDALFASLMSQLRTADLPNVLELVLRHLELRNSGGFGSLPLHGALTLGQLEELARRRPALLNDEKFVNAWMVRLAPGADENVERDVGARRAYLERLATLTARLSGGFNSFKAHVAFHRLQLDLRTGELDLTRFQDYLRLPRNSTTTPRKAYENAERTREVAELGSQFSTGFGPIANDEPLVRALLERFLRDAADTKAFDALVEPTYLKRTFAETKILSNSGDMERWYTLLDDPGYYEQLKQRVELHFAPTQKEHFGADEAVGIELDVKNVPKLLVKVYEIHALNYYTATGREIDASIDLDGLVANEESTLEYAEGPLQRVRRKFDFPRLSKPGTYVVEFIGNGTASRAVIRKGGLELIARTGAAGHVVRVVDERGTAQPKAALHLEGRRYDANDKGEIVVPFTSKPGGKPVVLESGARVALGRFEHAQESYMLRGDGFVDVEQLRAGSKAQLVLRPWLLVNDSLASLSLLEDAVLAVTTTNFDGTAATAELRGLELRLDREFVHELVVPGRLARLEVTLRGKITRLSDGEKVEQACSLLSVDLSKLERGNTLDCPLLGRDAEGWFVDVLGRTGEAVADRVLQFQLKHRNYTDKFELSLRSNKEGRIRLGTLDGVQVVNCNGFGGEWRGWALEDELAQVPQVLRGVVGETLRIAHHSRATKLDRSVATLHSFKSKSASVRDEFERLALAGEYLELRGLAAGDYLLWLKDVQASVRVQVTAGEKRDGWAIGANRALELVDSAPLAIRGVALEGDEVVVRLSGADPDARVHVFATRYMPALSVGRLGYEPDLPQRSLALEIPESDLRAGRELSDEYRYILERRFARKFPGNMLARPSLLLNPWELDEAFTSIGTGGGAGGRFGGRKNLKARGGSGREMESRDSVPAGEAGLEPNYEFLGGARTLAANLIPDKDGVVRVKRGQLGDGTFVHVVALDSGDRVSRSLALAGTPLVARDRRLMTALDPAKHRVEQRRIELVKAGETLKVDEASTEALQVYSTLGDVFAYFLGRGGNAAGLAPFEFLTRWPKLDAQEKRRLYSEHACHELHLFLLRKDAKFFEEVVKPYLANKLEKQFLDHWLLGDDVARYLEPRRFEQLNVLERILLTQRVQGRTAAGQRWVRDAVEVRPVDLAQLERDFQTALGGLAKDQANPFDNLGFNDAVTLGFLTDRSAGAPARQAPGAPGLIGGGGNMPSPEKAGEPGSDSKRKNDGADDFFIGEGERNELAESEELDKRAFKDAEGDVALRRAQEQQLFVPVGTTKVFAERNYWNVMLHEQGGWLVAPDRFWLDFAQAAGATPFLSTNFPQATDSLNEMLLALAVLDLPFEAAAPKVEDAQGIRTILPASPVLAVRKELRESPKATAATPMLVTQRVARLDDRHEIVDGMQREKYVRGEFLSRVPYTLQVVLTNPTAEPHEVELLVQLPAGSVPLSAGRSTKGVSLRLEPYSTARLESPFYFPKPGKFAHYPVHVAEKEQLVAFADALDFNVLSEPSQVDATSWEYVSQRGSLEDVLKLLDKSNLEQVSLPSVAWRMRDRKAYEALTGALRARLAYDSTLWGYALLHEDKLGARELLEHDRGLSQVAGPWLQSPLVRIDPVLELESEQLEFDPLVNPRAHAFGAKREVRNQLAEQRWRELLSILCHKPTLSAEDLMQATYQLLLQDRIEEALATLARVDERQVREKLQLDYLRAYAAFFSDNPGTARAIAERYREFPVERWQKLFGEVLAQLDEAEGKAVARNVGEDRNTRQAALAAAAPVLELSVEDGGLVVRHSNLTGCELSYFPMDIEFLFSTNPFVGQDSQAFAFVKPRATAQLALSATAAQTKVEVPAEVRGANVLVEVRSGGLVRRVPLLQGTLRVQWMEDFGQLAVTSSTSGKALPKTYVKVYAKLANGTVRFHKDGYTDLRGRFDYASMSGEGANDATRYAVLVASESEGAAIREIAPPAR